MREEIENQVKDLVHDTIIPAFSEDFDFTSIEEVKEALDLLKSLIATETLKYVFIKEAEEKGDMLYGLCGKKRSI